MIKLGDRKPTYWKGIMALGLVMVLQMLTRNSGLDEDEAERARLILEIEKNAV